MRDAAGEAREGGARLRDGFKHVDVWIFDLDNTLYPADCNLFRQIDGRMADFIRIRLDVDHAAARRIQKDYYVRYGTTLAGLMREHGVDPHDFMDHVHDIDLSPVPEHPELAARIDALPGRKYIFTNGSVAHAENVARKIGVIDCFDDVFDIARAGFTPKPHLETYRRFVDYCGVDPAGATMFEDLAHNLEAPHALGMKTVLVRAEADWFDDEPDAKRPARPGDALGAHIHHVTDDLASFLGRVI